MMQPSETDGDIFLKKQEFFNFHSIFINIMVIVKNRKTFF